MPDGNGKLTSAARGEIRLPIGVGDGAGAVRFFGVARKAVRYETELGEEKALAAAEKVTGIAGYTVLKRFADDLVDRVK